MLNDSSKAHILVIDDEEDIVKLLEFNLRKQGYRVTSATSGERGLEISRSDLPDLVILDLMLPGMDGLDVCRALKADAATQHTHVVMLSARGHEADIIVGLELGADDYIVKPFSPRVLLARVKSVLRRNTAAASNAGSVLSIGELSIDPHRFEVKIGGSKVDLTRTEFRIVQLFAKSPGIVFTRRQIVEQVHGDDYPVTERSIDVQMVSLRKKLGVTGERLETVRGIGYRLGDDDGS
jgi:two-component system, OmpR family, alkaline phosphatase synthesis response regulator PhoP